MVQFTLHGLFTLRKFFKSEDNIRLPIGWYKNVHSNVIHKSQKLETVKSSSTGK